MSILINRCLGRSRLAEDIVEQWQIEHTQAMFARDVEELVCEVIDLGKLTRHTYDSVLDELYAGRIDCIERAGNLMRLALSKVTGVFGKVNLLVQEGKARGFEIDRAAKFAELYLDVRSIEAEFDGKWPALDQQMVAAARADYERGDHQLSEDLLDEPQGRGATAN